MGSMLLVYESLQLIEQTLNFGERFDKRGAIEL